MIGGNHTPVWRFSTTFLAVSLWLIFGGLGKAF
jgi:hypothetical protein